MKLSEAMREGAKLVPQSCSGGFFGYKVDAGIADACVLGQALIGSAGSIQAIVETSVSGLPLPATVVPASALVTLWPELNTSAEVKPPCGCHERSLFRSITHLNDTEEWTTEKIADWLESLGK